MTNEVEKMLEGADDAEELRARVARLRAAPQRCTAPDFTARVLAAVRAERGRRAGWRRAAWGLAAAGAVLLAAGGLWLRAEKGADVGTTARLVARQRADGTFTASSAAPYVQAFAVTALARDPTVSARALDSAVGALVRDQDAAGGWANAALSARNVSALRAAAALGGEVARRAYRRGRRYLQAQGIGELSPDDLARAAREAARRLDGATADGLVDCVASLSMSCPPRPKD